jgi:hypothetical protein
MLLRRLPPPRLHLRLRPTLSLLTLHSWFPTLSRPLRLRTPPLTLLRAPRRPPTLLQFHLRFRPTSSALTLRNLLPTPPRSLLLCTPLTLL